jgi:hypothetical protein
MAELRRAEPETCEEHAVQNKWKKQKTKSNSYLGAITHDQEQYLGCASTLGRRGDRSKPRWIKILRQPRPPVESNPDIDIFRGADAAATPAAPAAEDGPHESHAGVAGQSQEISAHKKAPHVRGFFDR